MEAIQPEKVRRGADKRVPGPGKKKPGGRTARAEPYKLIVDEETDKTLARARARPGIFAEVV